MSTNNLGEEFIPFQGGLTIEEMVDSIQTELTIACSKLSNLFINC